MPSCVVYKRPEISSPRYVHCAKMTGNYIQCIITHQILREREETQLQNYNYYYYYYGRRREQKIYSSEGSKAVPARPSDRGRLEN